MSQSLIDFEHLAKYTDRDESLEAEILRMFVTQAEMWLKALHDSEDSDAWTAAAHSLKGSARGIGAWLLADLCAKAEELGPENSLEEHEAAYHKLTEAVAAVAQSIDNYLREIDAA